MIDVWCSVCGTIQVIVLLCGMAFHPPGLGAGLSSSSTSSEVQLWLDAKGLGSSKEALSGMSGSQLLGLSKVNLVNLDPTMGAAIYAALHGMSFR